HCSYDPSDAGANHQITTRGGTTKVTTGFEIQVEGCASCLLPRLFNSPCLRVLSLRISMESLSHNNAVLDNRSADHRIGTGEASYSDQGLFFDLSGLQFHRYALPARFRSVSNKNFIRITN